MDQHHTARHDDSAQHPLGAILALLALTLNCNSAIGQVRKASEGGRKGCAHRTTSPSATRSSVANQDAAATTTGASVCHYYIFPRTLGGRRPSASARCHAATSLSFGLSGL